MDDVDPATTSRERLEKHANDRAVVHDKAKVRRSDDAFGGVDFRELAVVESRADQPATESTGSDLGRTPFTDVHVVVINDPHAADDDGRDTDTGECSSIHRSATRPLSIRKRGIFGFRQSRPVSPETLRLSDAVGRFVGHIVMRSARMVSIVVHADDSVDGVKALP